MRTVTDDLGTEVSIPDRPRLVSLVPNLSETLWWWRLSEQVHGVTDHCVAPPSAFDHARRLRGTKNPDVLGIREVAPDVVVANEEENRERDVARLRDAGITVYVTRARSVTEAADSLGRLGEALGVAAAGSATRQAILRAMEQLRAPVGGLSSICPIWRDGAGKGAGETWWLVGGDTFAGDLLSRCGFHPAVEGLATGRYPRVALNELAAAGPAVVLLPDEPYAFGPVDAEVFATWSARVRYLDGTALSWWGPRTPHALGDLARLARQLARRPRNAGGSRPHSP